MSSLLPLAGVLGALLAAGVGIPIPEDLTLLGAGYLAWRGDVPLWAAWLVGLVGITVGDSTLYWIGRTLGPSITRRRFISHHLTPARLARLEELLDRHGSRTILLARLAAGFRGAFFLTAGVARMPYSRFLLFDLIAAWVSTTVWVLIGRRFGGHIDRVRQVVHRVEHVALLVVAAIALGWLLARWLRRRIVGVADPERVRS
jgi:membrane protein DedA with SNARE-associated domain